VLAHCKDTQKTPWPFHVRWLRRHNETAVSPVQGHNLGAQLAIAVPYQRAVGVEHQRLLLVQPLPALCSFVSKLLLKAGSSAGAAVL
jgi:hypothetical protein